MLKNKQLFSFVTYLLFATPAFCSGQGETNQGALNRPKVEMSHFTVKIIDPDGHPVEGATVFPSGLRSKVQRGGHWLWLEEAFGPVPRMTSDSKGLVELPYPKFITEKMQTGEVTVSVEHSDFVTFREDRNVADKPAEIQLKRGFRIAATAVDAETGKAINDNLYGLISGEDSRLKDWKLSQNGILVSPVLPHHKTWLRLVKIKQGEPVLFSDLIEINPENKSRVLLKDVNLSIGVRLEGKLDESVTRPVRNGYVCALISRFENANDWDSAWFWYDKSPIAEDGTFVFNSLPRDEVLQMIPICDDWVPKNPTEQDVLRFFPDARIGADAVRPQLVELNKSVIKATLKMAPATSILVKLTDQNEKPLLGVDVWSCPSQFWFSGGSQMLGAKYSTAEWLVNSRGSEEFKFLQTNRYAGKTDEHGTVAIKHLPPGTTQILFAEFESYEMPLNGTDRRIQVDLKPDSVAEVTIRMQPKGTQVLDDRAYQQNEIEEDEEKSEEEKIEQEDGE